MPTSSRRFPVRPATSGLAALAASAIWLAAGFVGAILAFVFAASIAVFAMFAATLVFLFGGFARVRRSAGSRSDPTLIEARRVGGHSWVAYGFEGPSTTGPEAGA